MIISHKYKFIFLKTRKTAGTSIEMWLGSNCGRQDVVTPIYPFEPSHLPQNYTGWFNPIPELLAGAYSMNGRRAIVTSTVGDFCRKRRFYNHVPGVVVQHRVSAEVWSSYWKWCVERDPLEKVMSDFFMQKYRLGGDLTAAEYLKSFALPINYPIYCDRKNQPLVDQVVEFDKLQTELKEISKFFGLSFDGLKYRAKSEYRPRDSTPLDVFDERQLTKIEGYFHTERQVLARIRGTTGPQLVP